MMRKDDGLNPLTLVREGNLARWGRWLCAFLTLALLAACSSALTDTEITVENRDQVYQKIQSGNELTGEEVKLLDSYLARHKAETGQDGLPVGKTIRKIIDEERTLQGGGDDAEGTPPDDETADSKDPASGEDGSTPRGNQLSGDDASKAALKQEPVEPPPPTTAILPAGTELRVRLDQALSSKTDKSGDLFDAILEDDLIVDGHLLAAQGSQVTGRLTHVKKSGRVKGRAQMTLTLHRIYAGDEEYALRTNKHSFEAKSSKKSDAAKVGIGAGAGALIGAIAGGGKGAAIGGAGGAGAGAGVVLFTSGKEIEFRIEHLFKFKLRKDIEMKIVR